MTRKMFFTVVVLFLAMASALSGEAAQKSGSKPPASKPGKAHAPAQTGICCTAKDRKFLPPAQADINERLRQAALIACVEEIKALLEKGAEVNGKDKNGRTALILASLQGAVSEAGYRRETSPQGVQCRLDTVNLLLERGADVNAKDQHGSTALMEATLSGRVKVAELLLNKGANVLANNQRDDSILIIATFSPHPSPELMQMLLARGADVQAKNYEGRTALHVAAEKASLQVAQLLLAKGANINVKDNEGRTPLMKAVELATLTPSEKDRLPYINFVNFAIANKADLNAKNKKGESVLKVAKQFAEWTQNNTIVDLLRKAGAKE